MLDLLARQMLYPSPPVRVPSPPRPYEEVELRLSADSTVVAWSYGPASAADSDPAVLFLHGNGENLETMRQSGLFDELAALGIYSFAVDYPGYGRSTGTPSEASLVAAAEAGLDWLSDHQPQRPRVIVGWSLGAAVAVQAAARQPVDGLVLLSAWDDLKSLSSRHFPGWLVRSAVTDAYDSVAAAAKIQTPVLMIHGDADHLIPIDCGRRLHAAFDDGAVFVTVAGAGHNDLMARRMVWDELRMFFRNLAQRKAR